MSATLATVNGILKEVYEGGINNQLSDERVTIKRIEQTAEGTSSDAVGGKYVVFPVRVSRNAGISYRAENTALAPAGRQGLKSATETLRYGYGRVRLTGQLIDLAESKPQSFANAMDVEMDGLKNDIARDENRIAYGHIDAGVATGIVAKVASIAGQVVTVDNTNQLELDMVVDFVNAGTPVANGTGNVISAINSATTFTVTGTAPTTVSGNYVVRTGDWDKEPYGLNRIVDSTGALHGLDPATTGVWKSVEDSTTTALTELAMVSNCDAVRRAGGGPGPSVIFASFGVRRAYFSLMMSLRRYNEPRSWTGGLIGLAFNYGKEIPVVEDRDCPDKTMFGINESELKIWRDEKWHWENKDNSILKWVTDYDAYEALMKQYWQFGTHKRNAHWKMTNVTEA